MKSVIGLSVLAVAAVGMTVIAPTSGMAQAKKHPAIQIITGPPAGTWYPAGAAFAELVNKSYDGNPLSVITGPGGVGNVSHTAAGKSGMGISYGPFLALAVKGNNEMYKDPAPSLCAIGSAPPNMLHMLVDSKYPPNVLEDLKAKKIPLKIATGANGSTEAFAMDEVLKLYGLTFKDIGSFGGRVDLMGTGERVDAWNNRQADVVNSMLQPPHAGYTEMMKTRPSHLISFSDKVRDQLGKDWGFVKADLPAGMYPDQKEPVKTVALSFVVYADAKAVNQELIYDFTKAWAENKPRMVQAHVSFKDWVPEDMGSGLGIAACEGAARFYKEKNWKF
jgi:TRAP transporter TAXI family solute receptor